MPQFYFDSHDGASFHQDLDGAEFSDLRTAKKAAASFICELAREASLGATRIELWVMLRDEHGRNLSKASATFEVQDQTLASKY